MKRFLILFSLLLLMSCKEQKMKYEHKQTVVNTKAKIKVDGNDKFILSFSDGESEYCSFGEYTKYKVGDTLHWEREKQFFGMWYVK